MRGSLPSMSSSDFVAVGNNIWRSNNKVHAYKKAVFCFYMINSKSSLFKLDALYTEEDGHIVLWFIERCGNYSTDLQGSEVWMLS